MARTLKEILDDLNNAEKEYAEKCKKYGIEEKHRKRKQEVQLDENGNPIEVQLDENGNPIVNQEAENQPVQSQQETEIKEPVQTEDNNQ